MREINFNNFILLQSTDDKNFIVIVDGPKVINNLVIFMYNFVMPFALKYLSLNILGI